MLILTHSTVRNPLILRVKQLPRKFFGRVTVWPKGRIGIARFMRIIVEFQWVRYTVSLLPLVAIGIIWNDLAMPLAQAPILMLILIWWIEMRVLRIPKAKRAQLIDTADAERGLDLLNTQARAVLTQIAAHRGLRAGQLHLVVEQSDLGLFTPLTYVSVQSEEGPEVLSLTDEERDMIAQGLFQAPLDEPLLQRINQSENVFLREVTLNARAVSAHARLTAALA